MKTLICLLIFTNIVCSSYLDIALLAEKNKEMEKAYKYYKKAAQRENETALFKLGLFNYKGIYVKKNYTNAKKYFEHASKLGHIKSFYNLGIVYSNKKSGFLDYTKAYKIFHGLAKEGYAPAQNRIGMFLSFGLGKIEKDYKIAVKWYEKASKQGFIPAQCNLAFMYASGRGVWINFGRAHAFAVEGKNKGDKICLKVWKDFNLGKYPQDKGWKFKFYNKP